jgi:hypothetical protein
VRDTALECDRRVFSPAKRFATAAGIASFAMFNDFGRAAQSAYFADASHITAIPLDAELKVFVGIKTLRIDRELSDDLEKARKSSDMKTRWVLSISSLPSRLRHFACWIFLLGFP